MKVIEKTDEKITIRMDTGFSLANAIRRSVEEIPTLAVDEVEIFKNDSALYDEFLAHRIGLVPLKTDGKMGASTSIDLKLVKKSEGVVYSGDIEGNAKVVYDKIPLTILRKGQEIEIIATAKLGTGLEHAKHVPGLCHYRNLLEIKSGNAKVDEIIEKSNGLVKEKKGSLTICDLSEAEIDEIKSIDSNVITDSEEVLFFVESFGHLSAGDIVAKAISALGGNLKEFEKALK